METDNEIRRDALWDVCADEGAGAVRPGPRPVPSGLHHERSGRRDKFCAAVHPCLRRALLRLRIQKERVTDDEEEGNHLHRIWLPGAVPLLLRQ